MNKDYMQNRIKVTKTGEIRSTTGIVDAKAAGIIKRGGQDIHCDIGYIYGNGEYIPTHIIVMDQILPDGTFINKELIDLDDLGYSVFTDEEV